MPLAVSSFNPMLRTVSIMPGIENLAPERQETSKGFLVSPKTLAVSFSVAFMAASSCSHIPGGNVAPAAR